MKNKLKIISKKSNSWDDSSYYNPYLNEIVVLDNSRWLGSLYHEYRHYIQFKTLPDWILIWANIGRFLTTAFLICFAILFSTETYDLLLVITVLHFILILPAFLMEVDANIFAIYRIYKKKCVRSNIIELLISLLTYSFIYCIFHISIILDLLSK